MFALATGSPGSKDNIIREAKKTHQREVRLAGHYLKVIPYSLFDFPIPQNLRLLDLSNNLLQDVPEEIGVLSSLHTLYLNGNYLEDLPSTFGLLASLRIVDLSRNKLKVVTPSINALKRLEWVNLSGNCLTEVPTYLLCLPNLKKVFCLRNTDLKNVPRSIAREGLRCMREYLKIQVEAVEPVLTNKLAKSPSHDAHTILDEIKSFLKHKQACHAPTSSELEVNSSYRNDICRFCGRSGSDHSATPLGNASTQTDNPGFRPSCYITTEGDPPGSDLKDYISSKRELDSSEISDLDTIVGSQNDVIEKLSKLFREQLTMVSDERTRVLLSQRNRKYCKSILDSNKPEHLLPRCLSCGLTRYCQSSSEYGTMTEDSHPELYEDSDLEYFSDNDSCCGITGSSSDQDCWSDDESLLLGTDTGFSTPRDENCDGDGPSWTDNLTASQYLTANKELVMVNNGAKVTIPEFNLSGHTHNEFSIQFVEGVSLQPATAVNAVIASPIIQTLPHGAKFFSSCPAIVSIPLFVLLEASDRVTCLVSDTGPNEPVRWEEIDSERISVCGDSVLVKTTHFSMFCAVASKTCPKFEKEIIADRGGEIKDDNAVEGVSVYFPPNSVKENMKASVELLDHDKYYLPHIGLGQARAIASPVVALEPSGTTFDKEVEITLPLPNGQKIMDRFEGAQLTVVFSQSRVGEKPNWQILHTPHRIKKTEDGSFLVSFFVQHFTLFGILWNILDSALPDDMKLYASPYIPHFSFWVFFQALMTECHHNRQFGICVICCRSGHPIQGLPQYPIEIGECKPRRIKSGELEIRLKSGIFRADQDAGEAESGLIKSENFTGREFDKQFACLFNDSIPEYGLLGQVEIRQKDDEGSSRELFSFNMVKSSKRKPVKTGREPSEWESKLFRDLAVMLSVDDHLWQEFALALGYNRYEISQKFGAAEDRMQEILLDYKTYRNGDAEEFSQALIKVARTFKLVPVDQMMENRQNRRAEHAQGESSTQRGRPARYCQCPRTPPKSPQGSKRKFEVSDDPLTDSRFDDIASKIAKSWKNVGRKLMLSDPELREIEINYQNAGEKEKAFQMLTTWRERDPDNCNMEVLYDALHQAGQRYTAYQCLGD